MDDIYVIGRNDEGEFGFDHTITIRTLKKTNDSICAFADDNDECIARIYSGKGYTIYSDRNHDQLWCAGNNSYGSCSIGMSSFEPISERVSIDYFIKNKINIQRICVNNIGYCTFWISDKQRVYGNGSNIFGQLGAGDRKHRNEPILIPHLKHVLDVQCGYNYSIALCENVTKCLIKHSIIPYWTRLLTQTIVQDVIDLILIFYDDGGNRVYSTEWSQYGGNGRNNNIFNNHNIWKKIDILNNNINIIKIKTGCYHSVFLESNGTVWSCGNNKNGECGIRGFGDFEVENFRTPVKIHYFIKNTIKIRDISCGYGHNLAIDENHRVYSWGNNDHGECGDGTKRNIDIPKRIRFFKKKKACNIQCGYTHSYCRTLDGYHYLFGSNKYNECFVSDIDYVLTPFCINAVLNDQLNGKRIKSISMGFCNTKIIVT